MIDAMEGLRLPAWAMVLPSAQMIAFTRAHSGEVGNASNASTGFSSFP